MNRYAHPARVAATLILPLALACGSMAHAETLDLDSLSTGMANSEGSPVPSQNQLTDQFLSQSVLISSTGGFAAVVVDGGSGVVWDQGDPTSNGLGGSNLIGDLDYAAPITFAFVDPTNGSSPFVTDAFSLYTDWFGDGSVVSLVAYDSDGNVVDSMTGPEHSGQEAFGTQYSVSGAGIHSVVFYGSPTTAISNIQFDTPVAAPEPLSLTALTIGFAALMRRKKR